MTESLVSDIVGAVAEARGVDPEELDFTLYEYIAADALHQLEAHGESTWTVTFEVPEHQVTVTSQGGVFVDGQQEQARTTV